MPIVIDAQRTLGFGVSSRRDDDHLVVEPYGELDIATSPRLEQVFAAGVRDDGVESVELDLTGVTFIDLVGVRTVCRCAELARRHGARFTVARPRPQTRRVFELCGLTGRWERH